MTVKQIAEKWGIEGKSMDFIDELMNCLSSIDYDKFDEGYINELLDGRDSSCFDTQWSRVYKEIETLKEKQSYTDDIKEEQRKIREKAFMIVERKIMSELSDYVSDDFGLIYDSLVLNYRDAWLDRLIEEYKNKRIPAGEFSQKNEY